MKKAKFYGYDGCDTCRKALKFLAARSVQVEKIDVTEQPPAPAELKKMSRLLNGEYRKLFNTSGLVYREMKLGDRLKAMSEADALALLAKQGRLVKRPFVLFNDSGVVGFKEPEWKSLFGA